VSGLAHVLENDGISTVIVALVREHIVSMKPPRALWVPFELGRPFSSPGKVSVQTKVLKSALSLFDESTQKSLLRDFEDESAWSDPDPVWTPPLTIRSHDLKDEATTIQDVWLTVNERSKKTTAGISGMSLKSGIDYIDRYFSANPLPNPKGMSSINRARFVVDDIKVTYLEAALLNQSSPGAQQLQNWFWNETLAGQMIREFQDQVRSSDDKNIRLIGSGLVPAERTIEYSSKS
jgi:hypothetical protein